MQACRHPSIILTFVIIFLASGCRGPQPGGLVRVTEDPTGDVPDIEPLPQRLATSRGSSEVDSDDRDQGSVDSQASRMIQRAKTAHRESANSPERSTARFSANDSKLRSRNRTVGTLAAKSSKSSRPDPEQSQQPSGAREAARSTAVDALMAANRGVHPQQKTTAARPTKRPATEKQRPGFAADTTPRVATTGAAPRKTGNRNAADAFAASPPDVQQQAIQRFVAAVAKKADRTVQPNSLNAALANSLNDLPDLPAVKNRQPKVAPKRLAMSSARQRDQRSSAPQATAEAEPQDASDSIGDDMEVVHVADLSTIRPSGEKQQLGVSATEAEAPKSSPTPETESNFAVQPSKPKPMAQPLDLRVDLESRIVQSGSPTADQDGVVRTAAATSDEDGKVAQAVGESRSQQIGDLEIPLPPLSLATPAPSEDLMAIEAIQTTAATATSTEATIASSDSRAAVNPEFMSDQELYQVLLARLSKPSLEETDTQRSRRLIMARHLMVLAGNPEQAAEKMEGLSKQEQKYLHHQLAGLWKMIDPKGHPVAGRRFSSALPELREATKYLAAATDSLEVNSLSFCTEIEAYGQIKTFSGNRFQPGQQVILYCEIDNFNVTKVDDGFETHLQGSYDVYNAENEKIVSQLLPADRQVASKYLRDYFIAYQMNLPKQLSPGTYRFQLTMEDMTGKKYGQASIPFEIAAE